MKISSLSVAAIAFAIAASATTVGAFQGTARVARLHGAARYSTGNNVWQTLHEGDILKPGAVIQTASESSVDIVLGGEDEVAAPQLTVRHFTYNGTQDTQQNVVRLRENTVLGIDKLSIEQTGADAVTDTQLDLRAGRIFGNVKKLSAASKYEIKLPNGVAGIRGTLFDLSTLTLNVFLGSVVSSIYDSLGKLVTTVCNGGDGLDLTNGNMKHIPSGDMDHGRREGDDVGHQGGGNNGGGNGGHGSPQDGDHCQTHPSPVVGENDQGEDNNNQGQNNNNQGG